MMASEPIFSICATSLARGRADVKDCRLEMEAELRVNRDEKAKAPNMAGTSAQARLIAFSKLGHRLCSARTQRDAIKIILEIADTFFGWDACTYDSYLANEDIVRAVIVIDR